MSPSNRPELTAIPGIDGKAEITISTTEHEVADKTIEALANHPDLYQRNGMLVQVVVEDLPVRGVLRGGAIPRIMVVSLARLREICTECVVFVRVVKTKDGIMRVAAHPPDWLIRAIHARGQWTGIRRLEAVIEAPTLGYDGRIIDRPGYDAATGLLFAPSMDFGTIDHRPTRDVARAELDFLTFELLGDFRFEKPEHRSACIAMLLTPLARYAIAGAVPLFLIDAPTRGSGKSLTCDISSEIASGRPMARMTHPEHDDEMRKRITALTLAGDLSVLIDNVVGNLGTPSLDAALTATTWKDRILGRSESTSDLRLTLIWHATGNNVLLQNDTERRVLHIRLDPQCERPEDREDFRHPNLLAWVRQERPRLVRAILTILRGFVVAGSPSAGLKPWGSFEAFSALVRGALVWLGEPDPILTRQELMATADTEAGALRALLSAWRDVDADGSGVTVAEILVAITTPGERYERIKGAILDLVPTPGDKLPSSRRIGKRLAQFRGRILDGLALVSKPNRDSIAVWSVSKAKVIS